LLSELPNAELSLLSRAHRCGALMMFEQEQRLERTNSTGC